MDLESDGALAQTADVGAVTLRWRERRNPAMHAFMPYYASGVSILLAVGVAAVMWGAFADGPTGPGLPWAVLAGCGLVALIACAMAWGRSAQWMNRELRIDGAGVHWADTSVGWDAISKVEVWKAQSYGPAEGAGRLEFDSDLEGSHPFESVDDTGPESRIFEDAPERCWAVDLHMAGGSHTVTAQLFRPDAERMAERIRTLQPRHTGQVDAGAEAGVRALAAREAD